MATAAPLQHRPSPLRLLAAPAVHQADGRDPAYQAYVILRLAFIVAPAVFGVDKFFNWMVPWTRYLWVGFANFLPGTPHQIMEGVGVLEIAAGSSYSPCLA